MAQNKSANKNKKKTADFSSYVKMMWKAFFGLLIFIVIFFFGLSMGWLGFMPSFEELENPNSNLASEVYSADGE
ncbi:MAG: hypothetical protein PHO12_06675, partial [Bacteroidales bacterium]|nr:hypothetical protein [Bacteroidales bacterium]